MNCSRRMVVFCAIVGSCGFAITMNVERILASRDDTFHVLSPAAQVSKLSSQLLLEFSYDLQHQLKKSKYREPFHYSHARDWDKINATSASIVNGNITQLDRMNSIVLVASVMKQFLAELNITWWLRSGSLVGIHRNFGFIPWDEDLDADYLEDDHPLVLEYISSHEKSINLTGVHCGELNGTCKAAPITDRVWIMAINLGRPFTEAPVRSFVKIFDIYNGVNGELWISYWKDSSHQLLTTGTGTGWSMRHDVPPSDIFPTRLAWFDGVELPIPNNPLVVVMQSFKNDAKMNAVVMYGDQWTETRTLDCSLPVDLLEKLRSVELKSKKVVSGKYYFEDIGGLVLRYIAYDKQIKDYCVYSGGDLKPMFPRKLYIVVNEMFGARHQLTFGNVTEID